jgi:hypothetical protein
LVAALGGDVLVVVAVRAGAAAAVVVIVAMSVTRATAAARPTALNLESICGALRKVSATMLARICGVTRSHGALEITANREARSLGGKCDCHPARTKSLRAESSACCMVVLPRGITQHVTFRECARVSFF